MTPRTGEPLFDAERWCRLRVEHQRLDALDGDARQVEIERIAAADPELADALRALLAPDADDDALSATVHRLMPADAHVPETIGPFRLLRQLGSGGMGVVYLGERVTAEFSQRVALKLLDGDAARMARHVARERRALAALNHPNITAFIDAGTDAGRTWLAMEYVDGEPLLDYCAHHGLGLRERVQLFEQVCTAVAHAHGQLVVHRDLKPANVLVNATGTIKLLDFGIALILDPTAEQTPSTRVFTPEYAAPEQWRGERVTTATDIHALGLMLFELVAGKRLPMLEHASGDEWTSAGLARNAANARPARADLTRGLRGDLGRILAHALAPDPARRYANALALRDDLQRWREYRPVGIARPSLRYVAARFLRRNRAAVAVAAIAVSGLLAATGFALWQAQRAQRFAADAAHGRDFVLGLFKQADPFNARNSKTSARDLLRDAAGRIDKEFASAPETRTQMRDAVAQVLARIGDPTTARDLYTRNVAELRAEHGERSPQAAAELQSLALASENAGDIDTARAQFEQSYTTLRDAGPEYAMSRISALTGLAKMANRDGDHARARRLHETVLAERMAKEGPESPDIAMDLMNLGADALYQERYADAETFAQRAHAMLEHALGPNHPRSIYVDNVLGQAQVRTAAHVAAGVATLESATALARAKLPPNTEMLGLLISALGRAHFLAGNSAEAITDFRQAHAILLAAHSASLDANDIALGLAELPTRPADALTLVRDAHARQAARHVSPGEANSAIADAAYGAALAATGYAAQGEAIVRAARSALLAGADARSVKLADIDRLLADVLARRGAEAEARTLREEAFAAYQRVYGGGHPQQLALQAQMKLAPPSH